MNRKSDLRHALSLMLSILLVDIICIVVFFSLYFLLSNPLGLALIQIIDLLVLISIIYLPVWKIGEKDINYVLTGRIPYDKYSGLKIGSIAMIALYLPCILLVVSKALNNQVLYALYMLIEAPFYGFVRLILPIQIVDANWVQVIISFIFPLIIPIITALAYHLGYKRISLTGNLIYKKKK